MTIFPNIIESFINESIIKRSQDKRLVKYNIKNIRDFADSPH
jgi:tRNA (guanine37-N1)-methyltransferase